MKFPRSREHYFPSPKAKSLYEAEAVLRLSPTRWLLLIFGCVLPEVSGAVIVFKISPVLSVLLFAAALSTLAFIVTFLRRQKCFVRIYPSTIEVETRRGQTSLKRKDIFDCAVGKEKLVILRYRDEVQFIELESPRSFLEAFQKMTA